MEIYRNFFTASLLGFFVLFLAMPASAKDLTSPSFIIRDPVVGTSGGYETSASFRLFSGGETLFTDVGSSLNFIGHHGFLYFPPATPPIVPPPGGGGGGGSDESPPEVCGKFADLNCDGLVNIEDLSILLYYFTHSTDRMSFYDLSEDGVLDIKDISIMFYYWDF